ncbi:PopZ family protein [Microvirga roseola]|uniref:PopZ family protein n=1 Tax=Microvirga roseola TaxID=2883126 RepID=UPI002AC33F6B|nr:DUF2497 domain-containing protein [Microvirga roseola]
MEEILASIRRIIADDQETLSEQDEEAAPTPLKKVLDMTERHIAAVPAPELALDNDQDDVQGQPEAGGFHLDEAFFQSLNRQDDEPPAARAVTAKTAPPKRAQAPVQPPAPNQQESLLSNRTTASVSGSFQRLGATLMPAEPRTLEDLMRDMLRPMLKEWLDENLPSIVERLVRAEIERAARGLR